jgi:hypothetical protein
VVMAAVAVAVLASNSDQNLHWACFFSASSASVVPFRPPTGIGPTALGSPQQRNHLRPGPKPNWNGSKQAPNAWIVPLRNTVSPQGRQISRLLGQANMMTDRNYWRRMAR